MADLTMCLDAKCPRRKRCGRFTPKPDPQYRSYLIGSPRKAGGVCEYYLTPKKTLTKA